ncbi:hypothetical protein I6E77_12480 [Bacteroides thetaiotaomicron]|jgi:hypothetical protein|uniref:hypothetical protein n=1 Tax=Bacteroides thetaiotaomicron TaxID=818 RepID=UPI001F1AA385|nr:hypothetical protein [Bacteroides thetaiotaomicron]MCF2734089.1 hypothetical protein [Bacteroides thetaiotaomicron]
MDKEILQVVEQIKKEIFESYVSKGLVASGEFGRDLKVNDLGDRVTITAPHYVVQMEQGRNAGSFPPVSAIKKWIQDKNRTVGANIPEEAAFAIAYVMKRDGIKVPNKYNGGGVVSDIINPERVKRLTLDINKIIKAKILTILTQ